jgi:hypothetical protein
MGPIWDSQAHSWLGPMINKTPTVQFYWDKFWSASVLTYRISIFEPLLSFEIFRKYLLLYNKKKCVVSLSVISTLKAIGPCCVQYGRVVYGSVLYWKSVLDETSEASSPIQDCQCNAEECNISPYCT